MLTPFGKAMRVHRNELNVNLKQMADALGVPSSYLSAIEHGRKPVSVPLVDAVHRYFIEHDVSKEYWSELAAESPTHVKLDLTHADELEREVYMAVGRRFRNAPHDVKEDIRKYIRSRLSDNNDEFPRNRFSRTKSN